MGEQFTNDFADRAEEWLNSYDTGASSKAIFHYMTLGIKDGSTPSDPADLARCLRLLDRFPEWKPRIQEMATVSDNWSTLMEHWDTIVASFVEEAGPEGYGYGRRWSAPKTYDMMHDVFYERRDGVLWRKRPSATQTVVIEL